MAEVRTQARNRRGWPATLTIVAVLAALVTVTPTGVAATIPTSAATDNATVTAMAGAAVACSVGQSGAAIPRPSSGRDAVRTTIGVAKTMGVPIKGQIIAVMVMFQESSIRNLANDGTTTHASWPTPGRDYWLNVTRLSLKYPHDKFGTKDGAHDTDSIGLYQQRPAYGWGNYGDSTGTTDPEGVVQRLLDPRWEAMAFFGGSRTAAPKGGLLDVAGWQTMVPTVAADAVQRSNHPDYYAQWEGPATIYVTDNQDAPAIDLPWYPGGGRGSLACTSIPSNPALGEAGRNAYGALDAAWIEGTGIQVTGWMLDPDAINGLGIIHFYDQGPFGTSGYPTGIANQTRDDVNRAYNVLGQYGYSTTLPWTGPGTHTICAYAINVGRGTGNQQIGCRTVVVPGPVGAFDYAAVSPAGQIDIVGWAADPAAPGARAEVHAYVTGPAGTSGTPGIFTGDARSDVARVLPWAGGNQGFHATVRSMGEGDNQVCLWAINVRPPNNNPGIACRTVSVRTYPVGTLDAVWVTGSKALVAGWTFDPTSPGRSIPVHIYVTSANGQSAGSPFTADGPRSDVNSVMGVSGNHGYSQQVSLFPGSNTVCAFGIGLVGGHNTLLGCSTVTSTAAVAPLARTAASPSAEPEPAPASRTPAAPTPASPTPASPTLVPTAVEPTSGTTSTPPTPGPAGAGPVSSPSSPATPPSLTAPSPAPASQTESAQP